MMQNYKKILGIAGNPVLHSLSPLFQNYIIESLNLDYIYVAFEVDENHFRSFIKGAEVIRNLVGLNITIPFKEEAYKCCDVLSAASKEIQVVNTIHFKDGKKYGYNTDIWGVINVIRDVLNISDMTEKTALVLGGGGGARAAIYGIKKLGGEKIYVVLKSKKRETDLVRWAKDFLNLELKIIEWGEINRIFKTEPIHLLINATPLGLQGENLPIDVKYVPPYCKVFDMAYSKNETPFVREAQNYQIDAVDGLYMLIYQGVESFKLWTGKTVETKSILDYLKRQIKNG